jgi:hypothetical protein
MFGPTFCAKDTEVSNVLPFTGKGLKGDTTRMTARGYEIASVNGIGRPPQLVFEGPVRSGFSPFWA